MKRLRITQEWEKELRHFPIHPNGIPDTLKKKVEERIAMEAQPKHRGATIWLRSIAAAMVLVTLFMLREPLLHLWKQDRNTAVEAFDKTTERSVKVQVFHRDTFMRQYGAAFTILHPNMSIDSIESIGMNASQQDVKSAYYSMLSKEQPDVLYLPVSIYKDMAADGLLYPLETIMQKDKYDLNAYQPGIIDYISEVGGGKLYGLAPTSNTESIFYNKTLFDRYGVPYPSDKMSWEELLRLAARFPTTGSGDDRVYGFASSFTDAYNAAAIIARTERISMIDPEGKKLLLNTPTFRSIWSSVADGLQKGWMSQVVRSTGNISGIDFYKRNTFMTGNAAMILQFPGFADDLLEAKKRYNLATFSWDIVTEPVDRDRPELSTHFSLDGVYAINAQTSNPKDAWELLKHINSEPMARKMAMQFARSGLSTRKLVLPKKDSFNTEAFSKLMPDPEVDKQSVASLPSSFYSELAAIINEEIGVYVKNGQSLERMMEQMQAKGQAALDKANVQPK